MVEITYPMVLSTIQTVSIAVCIFYYLYIMRNVQKTRQMENLLLRFQILGEKYNEASEDLYHQEWGVHTRLPAIATFTNPRARYYSARARKKNLG